MRGLLLGLCLTFACAGSAFAQESRVSITYESLQERIEKDNLDLSAQRASLEAILTSYEEAKDEILWNRTDLRDRARQKKEEGDVAGAASYNEQAKELLEATKLLKRQIQSLNAASNTMELRQTRDTLLLSAQEAMGAWHLAKSENEVCKARLSEAAYGLERAKRELMQGTGTKRAVDEADLNLHRAQRAVDEKQAELKKTERELAILCGYPQDTEIVVGALPELDENFSPDLQKDRQKMYGNNYELRALRHAGISGNNKERAAGRRSMAEAENLAYANLENLAGKVTQAKKLVEVAKKATAAEELTWQAICHKKELGMLNPTEYLAAGRVHAETAGAYQNAKIALFLAQNRYEWAIKGL